MTNNKKWLEMKVGVPNDIFGYKGTSSSTQCGPVYCDNRYNLFSGPFLEVKMVFITNLRP